MEIQRVVSGCDACLRAVLAKERLAPGESGLLNCRLDVRSLSGLVTRTVSIYGIDPDRPELALGITGVAVSLYQVTPIEPVLDLTQGGQTATAEILALQILRAPLSRVTASDTNIVASLTTAGSNRFVLAAHALPSVPHGRKLVKLTVGSSDTNDPPCRIAVTVHNPADLEVIPAQLQLRPEAAPQLRILWVKQRGNTPLTLLDVIPPSNKFHCEIDPAPPLLSVRLQCFQLPRRS